MATAIVEFEKAPLPAYLAKAVENNVVSNDDLISTFASFDSISIRGKVWRIVLGGEESIYIEPGREEPAPTIEVVIVRSNPLRSKTFYAKQYVEGEDAAPACSSMDGIVPDDGVLDKQSDTCAACPQNAIGSRITPDGKKARACADSRRLVVLPSGDLNFNPLLLRVPAASLSDRDNKENEARGWYGLAEYSKHIKQSKGADYNMVVTKISFDPRPAFPKLLFKAVRYLTQEEFEIVRDRANDPKILEMVGVKSHEPAAAQSKPEPAQKAIKIEKAVPPPVPVDDDLPVATPKVVSKPAPKPVVVEEDISEMAESVEDILDSIGSLGSDD